jgi:hypothetical protein
MVKLLAAEGEILGTPLTDEECETLAGNFAISDELSSKAKFLISRIFENEKQGDSNPRSFSNSMMWAVDPEWPNIAELTGQVASENQHPRLRGWKWAKDKLALLGCGLLVVLLIFAAVIGAGFIFHWK